MRTQRGDLVTDLILDVFKLSGLLVSEGDQLTAELGLTSARWKVLGAVALAEKPLTVSQIARTMGQSRQSVQRIANRLIDQGIFIYQNNPAHKRARLLKLTKKGQKIFSKLDTIQAPWANMSGQRFKVAELKTALNVLRELIEYYEN
ncbi:MAG: MarR family transcriptional regulator [Thermodesulfobacteriota bacterium]